MLRRIRALWVLGTALLIKLLLWPIWRTQHAAPWLSRLVPEQIAPTPAESWSLYEPASRCIGCGLCDAVGPANESPARWIASAGRSPGDAPLSVREATAVAGLVLEIAAVCPTRVGVSQLTSLIESNMHALRTP